MKQQRPTKMQLFPQKAATTTADSLPGYNKKQQLNFSDVASYTPRKQKDLLENN